jgi:hypothetical protein
MNFKKVGLVFILIACCSIFYFYKNKEQTAKQIRVNPSSYNEYETLTKIVFKDTAQSTCDCSSGHTACSSNLPKPIKVSYQVANQTGPIVTKKENKKVKKVSSKLKRASSKSKKRPNRKQAFIPFNPSSKENNIKGKAVLVRSSTVHSAKKPSKKEVIQETNDFKRYNRKSAFLCIDVMVCNSKGATKYHEKMCRGVKRCSTSIDTMKAFEAERKDLKPCKICFKYFSSLNRGSQHKKE